MDAITKESKEWLAALALVPEQWIANDACDGEEYEQTWKSKCGLPYSHEPHRFDVPIPDISLDLLYAIRRAIEARGYTWNLDYQGVLEEDDPPVRTFQIYLEDKIIEKRGNTEADAIIRAAASLQEAK